MFTLKKSRKVGLCAAMRCVDRASDLLCERHEQEWNEAGKPSLQAADSPRPAQGGGLLPVHVRAELDTERGRAQEALQLIQSLPLATSQDLELAGGLYNEARARVKALEEKRKSVTDPINAALREINGWFRPVREFYESCGKALNERMAARLAELKAEQDEALAKIQELKAEAPAEAFEIAHRPAEAPSNVGVAEVLEYQVVDFSALPDEYKLVNDAKIKQALRERGVALAIPGIVVSSRTQLRAKP